jgi:16S rRNA (adenine1518-N6/adenine1519-N6)-dimethyltransferase
MGIKHEPSLLDETRATLRRFDLRARKGLAQHFLTSRDILGKIVAAAELSPDDTVLEVGPGLGILTGELVRQARRVIAVELDEKLAGLLKEQMSSFTNLNIINRDIMDTEPGALIKEVQPETPAGEKNFRYKVVANLPYYITSTLLRHFLEASRKPELMVIMVQKEIARQIIAPAGKMSLLSVSVQFYGKPEIIDYVPAECFYPAPKVDSAILRISVYRQPALDIKDPDSFFRLVKAGFKAKRKQLVNSFSRGLELSKFDILPVMEKAGIDFTRRAETLTLDEWGTLYQTFTGMSKC